MLWLYSCTGILEIFHTDEGESQSDKDMVQLTDVENNMDKTPEK